MLLIRYLGEDGRGRWGVPDGPDRARPLLGDVFGSWCVSEESVSITRLLAPAEPPNIFAIGRNYREHAREMSARARETEPLIFLKATTSLLAPGEPIVLPASASGEVDYEAELAVIVGKKARNIPEGRALEYVFGFTCANDVSARDCQRNDKQWARAKSFDTFCPLGPVVVTADALRPGSLRIRSFVNDQPMQDANTAEMIFSVPVLVSYLSRQFTLLPGTVILTGTPQGVGAARTPPVFLRPGDNVTIEIEGIGRLTNPVVAERA